jgi:pentapeptide repeat protein
MAEENRLGPDYENRGWLTDGDKGKLKAVYQSQSACFSDLVRISGLSPGVDFRFSDLTGVDFAGSDLRGYNFVGANLSHTRWFKATWDETTNLEGALLTGARSLRWRKPAESFELIRGLSA